ncbi:MAG: hypothetical protein JXR76_27945 [Deltaproteobacteria bacterium]|nr:hypothetical protein [Deltaproteobacteria bacterium]
MSSRGAALVLGYPSAVSQSTAMELLENNCTVYLLISQDEYSQAGVLKKRFGKKLQLVVGRGDALDFGLTGKEYLKIAGEVELVFSLYAKWEGLRGSDFESLHVRELVEICKVARRVKRLLYLSDFSFTHGFEGIVAEHDLDIPSASLLEKNAPFRIERVLSRFRNTFPITVVRAGTMVGCVQTLFPLILMALAYPEQFGKSSGSLLMADVEWVARLVVEIARHSEPGHTFHLFQQAFSPAELGVKLTHLARAQVPGTYDLRAAARRALKSKGNVPKQLSAAQIEAKVENAWTNSYFRAHNFLNCDVALNWQPLVENEVEKLTGFR